MAMATAEFPGFSARVKQWVYNRDNYGIKTIGIEEDMMQFDTSLADLDDVIMTQYQLVAAASNIPVTKLMGTVPKGFNATGEFDESSYHEELESVQSHDLTPLIERHHLLLIRSEICPEFKIKPFHTTVVWNELDAMTAKEQAELNKFNAEAGRFLIESGAISPDEERQRVIADPNSGYIGLQSEEIPDDNFTFSDETGA
jgi:phage-related protein (TIGR01555 family)